MRLHLVVEGQTEETFVRDVLSVHLGSYGLSTDARLVEFSRSHGRIYRGGVARYQSIRRDISYWLREDGSKDVRFSSMLDLYGLPEDFPGLTESRKYTDSIERVRMIEEAFSLDIGDPRFLPYIQLHEFEALLFAEPHQ